MTGPGPGDRGLAPRGDGPWGANAHGPRRKQDDRTRRGLRSGQRRATATTQARRRSAGSMSRHQFLRPGRPSRRSAADPRRSGVDEASRGTPVVVGLRVDEAGRCGRRHCVLRLDHGVERMPDRARLHAVGVPRPNAPATGERFCCSRASMMAPVTATTVTLELEQQPEARARSSSSSSP